MNMVIVIKILGTVIALIGVGYLIRPGIIKWFMGFFKKGNRIYFPGALRFVLAVVFFVAARECRYPWIIFGAGVLFLIGGLLILLLGPEKIRRMLDWYQEQPMLIFRVIAATVVLFGAVIIFSA